MLYDGIKFVGKDVLPSNPIKGEVVYLTKANADYEKGLYSFNGEEWSGGGSGSGIDSKDSVLVATRLNIVLSGLQVIDTIPVLENSRVLVKDQTDPTENGIYVAHADIWTRSSDANTDKEVTPGLYTYVEDGAYNGGSSWILQKSGEIGNTLVIGQDDITFAKFSGDGQVRAGDGLVKIGESIALGNVAGLTVGTFNSVTINDKGQVTKGANPNTLSGFGITDAQTKVTGAASTVVTNDMLVDRVIVTNSSGKLVESDVTAIELTTMQSDVNAVRISVQDKQDKITGAASTILLSNLGMNKGVITDADGKIVESKASSSDFDNLEGTTGNVQEQLDDRLSKAGGEMTGEITTTELTPSAPNVLASKSFVQEQVSSISPMPRSAYVNIPGEIVPFEGGIRWYPPFSVTLSNVQAFINTPSEITPIKFDILKNGVSVFAEVPELSITENESGPKSVDAMLTSSDYLTVSILQGGGSDLSIRIDYNATV